MVASAFAAVAQITSYANEGCKGSVVGTRSKYYLFYVTIIIILLTVSFLIEITADTEVCQLYEDSTNRGMKFVSCDDTNGLQYKLYMNTDCSGGQSIYTYYCLLLLFC